MRLYFVYCKFLRQNQTGKEPSRCVRRLSQRFLRSSPTYATLDYTKICAFFQLQKGKKCRIFNDYFGHSGNPAPRQSAFPSAYNISGDLYGTRIIPRRGIRGLGAGHSYRKSPRRRSKTAEAGGKWQYSGRDSAYLRSCSSRSTSASCAGVFTPMSSSPISRTQTPTLSPRVSMISGASVR